jgi:hypothetical protein
MVQKSVTLVESMTRCGGCRGVGGGGSRATGTAVPARTSKSIIFPFEQYSTYFQEETHLV